MKNREKFRAICWVPFLGGLGVLGAAPLAAHAQAQSVELEEIVVTAEHRAENVQRTASSVSVRSGDALEAEGKYSLASILEDVPGMGAFTPPVFGGGTDSTASALNIRGIPSNIGVGGSTTSVSSSAAIYVDGVYEGAGGGYDIDRVEILRGPQGTLYGRSATSGVVAIHTRDPELGDFGGNISAEFGNYNLRHYNGAVNIPLGDKFALRISGNRYERNGFWAKKEQNTVDSKDYRVKFLAKPTDNLSILLGAAGADNNVYSGGVNTYLNGANGYRFEYVVNGQALQPASGANKTRQYWAEINWDLGFANLTYLPAYRSWNTDYQTRTRTTTFSFNQRILTPKDDFVTHEVRLASAEGSKLLWQAGTLLYDNDLHNINDFTNEPAGSVRRKVNTQRETKAWGVFAEATYPITDKLRVTGGLRYDETDVAVTQTLTVNQNTATAANFNTTSAGFPERLVTKSLSGKEGERSFTATTYKARIEYDLTPQNMLYAVASSAASPGDVTLTADANSQPIVRELSQEINKAYEIGSKNRFLDNRLQVNGSVYYNDYSGFQSLNINVNPVPPPAGSTIYDTLVAPMKVVGGELEVQFQPTANDVIGLNLAYTHSYFSDRSVSTSYGTTFGDYFGLSDVPKVIPLTAQVSYDHTFHPFAGSRLVVGGDVRYTSEYYVDRILASQLANPALRDRLLPLIKADAEVLLNLSSALSFADGKYSITGWVRNVTDNRFKTSAGISSITAGNINTVGSGIDVVTSSISPPRTWGVSLNAKF